MNFRISVELADELKILAIRKKVTIQSIVIPMIEQYISENKKI